jgi:integrase/recombinase XerD
MLAIYKRHSATCDHKDDRHYRRCECVYWVEGTTEGVYYRESLKTRSYERATSLAREIEDGKSVKRTTVKDATTSFLDDARVRGLRPTSLYKYELLFRRLEEFVELEGLRYVTDLEIEVLRRWRSTWKHKNHAARVTTANLRAFLNFCFNSGWFKTNPAKLLRSPEVKAHPVIPFTQTQYEAILQAARLHKGTMPMLAFVLLLRWSGLRIADAVTLQRSCLFGDKLQLQTEKTGTVVRVPLPPECVTALNAIPKVSPYFFWNGNGKSVTRVGNYEVALRKLFENAGVVGHAHKFRHLFATTLLESGAPVERVARLMGHSNSRVTSETYSTWIKERQDAAEDDVRRSWTVAAVQSASN